MIKRIHYQQVKSRLESPVSFIQVLIGPRQVGKTTLIKQVLQEIEIPWHYASADAATNNNGIWIEQQWETARQKKKQQEAYEFILVLDEVQKIGNWSEFVKAHWDRDRFDEVSIKVVLLGSSSLLIQKGLTESLTGRYELIKLMHWSFSEMEEAFGFTAEQFVWFGGYPGAAVLSQDEERWKHYVKDAIVEPSIMKDILLMTRIDKPALLRNLFELSCDYSGQLLSLSKIVGQLQDAGNTTTLAHYFKLLDAAGLSTGLSKIYIDKSRQKASVPKFQVYNTAFLTVQKNETLAEILFLPEKWGRHVESAIGAHLLNFAHTENFEVFYWRDRNDEIDFVIKKQGKLVGLEVKSGKLKNTGGIKAFKETFNPDKILLIGSTGIPWQDFLKMNPMELF